jgi:hypothetical protein
LKQTDFKLIRPNEQMRLIKFLLEESGAKVEDMKKELFAVLNEITFYKSNNVDIETIEELEHAREISLSISYDQFVDIFKAYENHLYSKASGTHCKINSVSICILRHMLYTSI